MVFHPVRDLTDLEERGVPYPVDDLLRVPGPREVNDFNGNMLDIGLDHVSEDDDLEEGRDENEGEQLALTEYLYKFLFY
jgi:hypothetical protein